LSVDGTIAFVDVSGFTKLSEALAKHGKIGAEELAATIGQCFSPLLAIAYANGGRLLKFGGDALLLLFSGEEHQARACRAAFEMRRALRVVGRLTVLGHHVTLRMSVGIHSGLFDMFLVGRSHRELVVAGPAASATVVMESRAAAGEILVSPATAAALAPGDLGPTKGDGRLLRRPPVVAVAAPTPLDPVGPGGDLSECIPVSIVGALMGASHEPEHRRVAVAFVHFDGTDEMLAGPGVGATAGYLDQLITDIQEAVDARRVTFLGTDIDHDGGKVILVAGAPSTSGDDEDHMLLALRQIMDRDRTPPLRVGVNRGPVFAGDIGPSFRRTFTVMGDTVNLAARLMAKAAPRQILATPEVLARSRSEFAFDKVPPFTVKGKAKPVDAVDVGPRVGARTVEDGASFPLVGRRREMAVWREKAEAVMAGSGSVVEVVGEPGVGKSRLIEEFRSVGAAAGMVMLSVTCEYYDSSTPYGALRGLLRRLLGLEEPTLEETTKPATAQRLAEVLTELAPELVPWAPLIGAVADIDVPATPETSELGPEFWALRRGEVMTKLLDVLLPSPTVLVVEDAHWMDEASAELLRHVLAMGTGRPWLWCLTRRDVESGFVPKESSCLRLEPLAGAEATQLAQVAARDAPLPAHQAAALVERSGGNPLFLRELVAAAREAQDIDELPDSIEAVIAARIDRLSADDRQFLRRASVLGRTAPVELLGAVLEEVPGAADPIWARLGEFAAPDEVGNLVFRHALLRDSAYDGLSYRLRRQLHASAGEAIRTGAGDNAEEHAELLSMHYLQAQEYGEAWKYSLVAAERARAVYANVDAAEFYERALAAARRLLELTNRELAQVHEALGDVRDRSGGYVQAVVQYRGARRLVRDDPLADARLMLKLARIHGWKDGYADALRWITRALHLLQGVKGLEAERQRAQLLAWYARFCQERGHHGRAITWSKRAIAQAELADEKEALANALLVLDWAQMELGRLDRPTNWERALALMEELGDLHGQGRMLNSLAVFAYYRGRWDEAHELYGRAQDMARRSGSPVHLAVYEGNMAEIALDQGRAEEAERLFESVSRTCRAAGHRSSETHVTGSLARAAARLGRYDDAKRLFEEAWQKAVELGGEAESLEVGARWAECQLLAGDVDGARARAEAGLERARALGGVAQQLPLLHRVRGVALARGGDRHGAAVELGQSLEAARLLHVEYEAALTMGVMAALGLEREGRAAADLEWESKRILDGLGVVSVPDLMVGERSLGTVALSAPAT
jgi:class 3 adenylate cyclase/tetratricopeptide (TPR) repeat protein